MSFLDGGPKRPKFEGERHDYRPKRPRFTPALILIGMLLFAILVRILQLQGYF
ncbi:hypothetical protein [Methylocystis sp.]|uniref:hypothetical protein n=1 Tax=Methylocystis sp. TaxID=1911079 RepID=UPI003D10B4B2